MKSIFLLMVLSLPASALTFDEADPLNPMRRDETLSPTPMTDRYFGGYNDPAVVVPIQPGTGSSYIGRDQVMTDHQYCFRSAVSGALICQGH